MANPGSYKSEPIFEIETDVRMTMKDVTFGIDWFTYPCHMGVMLVTEKDKFHNNRPAFDTIVESLAMHEIPEN